MAKWLADRLPRSVVYWVLVRAMSGFVEQVDSRVLPHITAWEVIHWWKRSLNDKEESG